MSFSYHCQTQSSGARTEEARDSGLELITRGQPSNAHTRPGRLWQRHSSSSDMYVWKSGYQTYCSLFLKSRGWHTGFVCKKCSAKNKTNNPPVNIWAMLVEAETLFSLALYKMYLCMCVVRAVMCVRKCHRQQCNAATYMLLTAFWCKNFAITIFTWGSLWVEMLFFLLLFVRNCRFARCSNSKLSLSIPSVVQSKKVGRDMNAHLRRRS